MTENKKTERYYANGIAFDLVAESDNWISIYKIHPETYERIPMIQAADIEHAKSYCDMIEPINVPFNIL